MTTRHALLHDRTVQALLDLSNPKKSVCLPLVKGKAAGKLDLIYQLFPPRGVHPNSIPATYTFVLDEWVTHEIELMVSMVGDRNNGLDDLTFGFISHDHWCQLKEQTGTDTSDAQTHFVAVKYNPTTREGFIYLYKEAYAIIEKLNKGRLESVRQLKREKKIAEAIPAAKPEERAPPPKEGALNILLADDNESLRSSIARGLIRERHIVEVVCDGAELLGRLDSAASRGEVYDLVITDNDMPRATGLQVLKIMRKDDRWKDLPVIVFTGSDDLQPLVEASGGVYLAKDEHFSTKKFIELIEKVTKRAS